MAVRHPQEVVCTEARCLLASQVRSLLSSLRVINEILTAGQTQIFITWLPLL